MIIPKEIQALGRLKGTLLAEGYWQDVLEDFAIIENALNEYYRLLKEDNETTKKLQALEIIKKHPMFYLHDDLPNGTYRMYDCELYSHYDLTEEEYSLLREVLL